MRFTKLIPDMRFSKQFLIFIAVTNLIFWVSYFSFYSPKTTWSENETLIFTGGYSAALIAVFILSTVQELMSTYTRKPIVVLALAATGSTILFCFTTFYSALGSESHLNFGVVLSKVDAFYFALGVFTTAGTGTIAPLSQVARLIVSCQYIVDVIYVAGLIGVGVSRLSSEHVIRLEESFG
jgi:hypothetical protein